ncbi:hypothetical protein Tco_0200593 [Tanacetum coccineum]
MSQGIVKLPRSFSFDGSLFNNTAEHLSFIVILQASRLALFVSNLFRNLAYFGYFELMASIKAVIEIGVGPLQVFPKMFSVDPLLFFSAIVWERCLYFTDAETKGAREDKTCQSEYEMDGEVRDRKLRTVLGSCDEFDGFVSIPDEGDMAFLRKKVKSGAAVGKRVLLQIIMANLPPLNNDLNVPEDEHAPAPEHAPIAPNHAPIQPNDYLADDEEDLEEELEEEEDPIPQQAPVAPAGFAP